MQIATDADSEIITEVEVTPANVDDSTQLEGLVDGHQRKAESRGGGGRQRLQ